ncbi:MAG: methyltransferase domain-containing protein [Planctomycetes bacterium]|nr:methyltransferase domain-containing protein [Planctomycetota bacterium]
MSQAERADRFALYERAVQEPAVQVRVVEDLFRAAHGRPPADLREDFAGTALFARTFVEGDPARRAWAVDLDPAPLAWARARGALERVTLVEGDVLDVGPPAVPAVDVVVALNYSFFLLAERAHLRAYLARAREGLRPGGALVLEVAGGPELQERGEEATDHGDFTFVWDQVAFDPIHSRARCAIHFAFPDGSELRDAFTYEWRVWSIVELRELLAEVGFARSVVLWEGPGADGEGDRTFVPCERAPAEEAWIAYVVGWRAP